VGQDGARSSVAQLNNENSLIERTAKEPDFLNNIVTADESRVFQYDFGTKIQILQLTTDTFPRSKKVRMSRSRVKMILSLFCDIHVSCTTNIFHGGKRSTTNCTKMLWSV
jgi:hypothetical protein